MTIFAKNPNQRQPPRMAKRKDKDEESSLSPKIAKLKEFTASHKKLAKPR
jgi:hypothetical protein